MAKRSKDKKRDGKMSSYGSDDEFDDDVTTSDKQSVDNNNAINTSVARDFDTSQAVEDLGDKSLAKRTSGFNGLIRFFRTATEPELELNMHNYQETICSLLQRIIRKPSGAKEALSCLTLLSLIGLQLGAENEDFVEMFTKSVLQLVPDQQSSVEVRASALRCISLITFICSTDKNHAIWTLCEDILSGVNGAYTSNAPPLLKAAAAECWILLSTGFVMNNEFDIVLDQSQEVVFEALLEMLEESDIAVKIAAVRVLLPLIFTTENNLEHFDNKFKTINLFIFLL